MPKRMQRNLRGALTVVLVVIGASVFSVQYTLENRRLADDLVTHTLVVLNELETSLRSLREVESSVRGLLLHDDPELRLLLEQRRKLLHGALASLGQEIRDNPVQVERQAELTELARSYDTHTQQVLKARAEDHEAYEALRERYARQLSARFEDVIGAMRKEERALLAARRDQARKDEAETFVALIFLGLVAGAVTIATFVMSMHHMHERARAEAELRSAHQSLDVMFENIPNVVFLKDAKHLTYARLNRAGEELLGVKRGEVLGKTDLDVFPAERARQLEERDRQALAGTGTVEAFEERLQTTGGERWLRTRKVTLRDRQGNPEFLLGISEDITEAKQREALLLASEARFRGVVERSSEAIIVSEPVDGRVLEANEAAARLFGGTREQLLGRDRASLVAGPPERAAALRKMRDETGSAEGTLLLRRQDGSTFEAELSAGAFKDLNGELRMTVFVRDVSARVAYEQSLIQAKVEAEAASKELEAFCYSVSHDLRAPLRGIDGFSQALLEDCGDQLDEIGKGHIARVRRGAQRMAQLIDDLLNLSRLSRAELVRQDVDLSAMACEIVDDLRARAPKRNVDVDIAPNLHVRADARLLRIALENLLGNAWKFTSRTEGARIEVCEVHHEGKHGVLIRDNGAGFDAAYKHRLFGAFQRLHGMNEFEGSGIGLAIVLRVVQRHGGRVWADGEPGRGASFILSLAPELTAPIGERHDGNEAHPAG